MSWNCHQLEQRLSEYLEGALPATDLTGADEHARSCPRCAEWFAARQATAWLHRLEPLASPPGLETRILAQTVAPPPEEGLSMLLERAWRMLLQPRFALGLAAAIFSITLVLNALDVSPAKLQANDLNPVTLYRRLDRQAHRLYARSIRFVNDLRLVYEIRSRLETIRPEPEQPPGSPSEPPVNRRERKRDSAAEGEQYFWLLAYQTPGGR